MSWPQETCWPQRTWIGPERKRVAVVHIYQPASSPGSGVTPVCCIPTSEEFRKPCIILPACKECSGTRASLIKGFPTRLYAKMDPQCSNISRSAAGWELDLTSCSQESWYARHVWSSSGISLIRVFKMAAMWKECVSWAHHSLKTCSHVKIHDSRLTQNKLEMLIKAEGPEGRGGWGLK